MKFFDKKFWNFETFKQTKICQSSNFKSFELRELVISSDTMR